MTDAQMKALLQDTAVRQALVALVWRVGLDCFGVGLEGAGRGAKDFEACIQPDGDWQSTDRGAAASMAVKIIASRTLLSERVVSSEGGE